MTFLNPLLSNALSFKNIQSEKIFKNILQVCLLTSFLIVCSATISTFETVNFVFLFFHIFPSISTNLVLPICAVSGTVDIDHAFLFLFALCNILNAASQILSVFFIFPNTFSSVSELELIYLLLAVAISASELFLSFLSCQLYNLIPSGKVLLIFESKLNLQPEEGLVQILGQTN